MTPKRIFLADDNHEFRTKTKTALEVAGHLVLVEAKDGKEALEKVVLAKELQIDTAVLDCHMPNEEDGPRVAGELNKINNQLLVVSVSDHWRGNWPDPNYDKEHLHPADINSYDINGRGPMRRPDLSARQFGWDLGKLAQAIGEWEFSLQSKEGMKILIEFEEMNRQWKERK